MESVRSVTWVPGILKAARRSYCTVNTKNLDMYLQTDTGAREHPSPPPCRALMFIKSKLSHDAFSHQPQGQRWFQEKILRGYFRCMGLSCFYNTSDTKMWGFSSSGHQPILTPTGYPNIHFSSVINWLKLAQIPHIKGLVSQECPLQAWAANGVPREIINLAVPWIQGFSWIPRYENLPAQLRFQKTFYLLLQFIRKNAT